MSETEGFTPDDQAAASLADVLDLAESACACHAAEAPSEESREAVEARVRAQIAADWTINPETGRSNSSPLFLHLADEVTHLIVSDAFQLLHGRADRTGGLIMAQLAHKHGLRPASDPAHSGDTSERDETPNDILREIKAELNDAFQFTETDGSRHSYVTREWVEALLARAVERGSLLGPRVDRISVSRADFRRVMLTREDDPASEEYEQARHRLRAAAEAGE